MVVEPEPVTLDEFVTSIVSTITSPVVFLIVIFPVLTSTASENVNTIFAEEETPVALSAGLLEDNVGGTLVNETVAVSVTATLFNVAEIVAVPTVVEVSVAVYVPSELSVTELNVPNVEDKLTVSPPFKKLLPNTSLTCTVIVELDVPLANTELGDAETVDVVASAASS